MKAEGTAVQSVRWCASCALTLACWAVWLALGGTLGTLAYVTAVHEVPVPDFLLRRVEREFASAQLSVRFGRTNLDPTGRILLHDVQVRSTQFDDPLLTSRVVFLRLDFWSLLAGQTLPDEIHLEGAALQVPAPLSPTGAAAPLVSDLAAVVRRHGRLWQLDQFAGRVGRLRVVATGQFAAPPRQAGRVPPKAEEFVGQYLGFSRRLLPQIQQLDAFDDPVLGLSFALLPGMSHTADLAFTARAAHRPWGAPVTCDELAAATTLRIEPANLVPLRLLVAARHFDYHGEYAGEHVRAALSAQLGIAAGTFTPGRLRATAASVSAVGEVASSPSVQTDLGDLPRLPVAAAFMAGGQLLSVAGDLDLAQKSARLRAEGVVAPALFARVAGRHAPRLAGQLTLAEPVAVRAEAEFAPGWKLTRAGLDLAARNFTVHGVRIDATRGHVDFDGHTMLAHDAMAVLGDNHATGSYWMDFATKDYRMLLTGRLRPPAISPWFSAWWPDLWKHFDFPVAPPAAEVDVAGRWGDPTRSTYFGGTDSGPAVVRGADFEQAHLVLVVRPHLVHALELAAHRAGGQQRLSGWFKRSTDPVTNALRSVEFDLTANVDPPLYGKLLDVATGPLLALWRLTQVPQLHAAGRVDGAGPDAQPRLVFSARTATPLHFHDFPLESLAVAGGITPDELRLDSVAAGFAGGTAAGKVWVRGPAVARRLQFDLGLKNVDLARAIRAVEAFEAARATPGGTPAVSVTESKFIKQTTGGTIEAALAAEGHPGDLASFKGKGNARVSGAELAEVHLFGLLSQLLSGVGLGFTSLRFDHARADFQLEASRLHFTELKVTGRNAALDARGAYHLDTKTLDFTARLNPFEESRALIPKVIDLFTNPLTTFLELKLTGPLSKPSWAFVLGPTNILRALVGEEPTPGTPPPPAPGRSEPAKTPAVSPPANNSTVPPPGPAQPSSTAASPSTQSPPQPPASQPTAAPASPPK